MIGIFSDVDFSLLEAYSESNFSICAKSKEEMLSLLFSPDSSDTNEFSSALIAITEDYLLRSCEIYSWGLGESEDLLLFLEKLISQIRSAYCIDKIIISFLDIRFGIDFSAFVNPFSQIRYQFPKVVNRIAGYDSNIYYLDLNRYTFLSDRKLVLNYMRTSSFLHSSTIAGLANDLKFADSCLSLLPAKVLLLDLDNTLWGGVLREDGWQNVKVGGHSSVGLLYLSIQRMFKALKDRGLLLCLVTKNYPSEVEEAFLRLTSMPLRYDDFILIKATDSAKSSSIRDISDTLNISIDQMIFIDDSLFERREVLEAHPKIQIIGLSKDIYSWPTELHESAPFRRIAGSLSHSLDNKSARTDLYRQNLKRLEDAKALNRHTEDNKGYERWLGGVNQVLSMEYCPVLTDRVVELFQRTNQFNISGNKRSRDYINRKLTVGCQLYQYSLEDKYGQEGVIGAILCSKQEAELTLHEMLLSCRVFNRGVEFGMIDQLLDSQSEAVSVIRIEHYSSGRNRAAAEFINKIAKDGVIEDLSTLKLKFCGSMKIKSIDER